MMHDQGLTKLAEECGELVQIAMKKATYPEVEIHPDGKPINSRLEEEIGDVLAAIGFAIYKHSLDTHRIEDRRTQKLKLFEEWDRE